MQRWLRIAFTAVALTLGFAVALPERNDFQILNGLFAASAANAQERRRKSLFGILFGRRKANRRNVRTTNRAKRKTVRRQRTTKRKRARRAKKRVVRASAPLVAAPQKPVLEKQEDARIVLVVGDFLAGGLADGLSVLLSDAPNVRVIDESNGLSGLVRDDVVDWPAKLPGLLEEHKPAYLVVQVGTNDRQLLRENGKKLKTRSEEWDAAYKARIAALADVVKGSNIPYSWVGLPPLRFKNVSKDFLVFNEWYGAAAPSERGKFVDVWDGFTDAEGNYSRSGPDVNGQITLLRSKDGINLTKAGKRRLAFYVEADIRRVLDAGGDLPGLAGLRLGEEAGAPAPPAYDPLKSGRTVVISLDDPAADGAETLAGAEQDFGSPLVRRQQETVVPAQTNRQPEPRADNFVWPPRSYAGSATPSPVAANSN